MDSIPWLSFAAPQPLAPASAPPLVRGAAAAAAAASLAHVHPIPPLVAPSLVFPPSTSIPDPHPPALLHYVPPPLRRTATKKSGAPFPPAFVAAVTAAVSAAALVGPLLQSNVQRASPVGLEFHSASAGLVGPPSLVPLRRGGIRRRIGLGRLSFSRLLCGSLLGQGGQ